MTTTRDADGGPATIANGAAAGVGEDVVLCALHTLPGDGGSVAVVTLNRPNLLNAINWQMVRGLSDVLDDIDGRSDVRAVLLTGAGRGFSAGGDLTDYRNLQRDAQRFPAFVEDLQATFLRLRELRAPVVALVNGVAAAGGLELLLSCDMAIAAKSARIGDAHLNFGQMGGGGSLTLLPRMVGIARATELVLTGRFLSAVEALEWGLIGALVEDDALLDAGMRFAEQVARKSPLAVANAKYVMNVVWAENLNLRSGLNLERERNSVYCLTSEDVREGLTAFAERRDPQFTGR